MDKVVEVSGIKISNSSRITIFGGLNVLESKEIAFRTCEEFLKCADALDLPFVFKASFDKANRSSIYSYRGPGLDAGLRMLQDVKREFGVPVLTDVHEPAQADSAAQVVDILQIPAFLARQTDLVAALAKTGKPINVKKPQFMSPHQLEHVVRKFAECGNTQLLMCERGSCLGYDNLVVDMLGFKTIRESSRGCPMVFDVTHSLQFRDPLGAASNGRRSQVFELARAGVAVGIAALFVEAHPNPDAALCDGPCALPLANIFEFLHQVKTLDDVVKAFPAVVVD